MYTLITYIVSALSDRECFCQYGLAILAILGTICAVKIAKKKREKAVLTKNREERKRTRKEEEEEIERKIGQFKLSEEQQQKIHCLSVLELQDALQKGKLSALDVLYTYQTQAFNANKKTNAITGYLRDAETHAEQCDQVQERSERLLHGMPVSIKECYPIKGHDVTVGCSRFIGQIWTDDCVLVKVLRHQGGIPFVRTNVPQTQLSFDTCNPIYGQTRNPIKTTHSAGGSSGGEGALLAAGGSIIGLGSDIGGSIRMPAAFCGIYGFKPTSGRLSNKGTIPLFKGQNLIKSTYGPMARDVDGLVLLMKALLCPLHFELDKKVPPIPFREELFNEERKLRIGYYLDDGFMACTPMMKRAVTVAIDALRSKGYEVVEWKFPNLGRRGVDLFSKAIFSDGGKELREYVKNDVLDHSFSTTHTILNISRIKPLHSLLIAILKIVYPTIAVTFGNAHGIGSIDEFQQVTRDIDAFKQEIEDDLNEKNIDIILAPGFTMPAPRVGDHRFMTGVVCYTTLYNCLDFPAGSLPVTKATADDVAKMADYPTRDLWHRAVKKGCMDAEGLPLNVQLVAPPWQEERCLRVMKDLETALKL